MRLSGASDDDVYTPHLFLSHFHPPPSAMHVTLLRHMATTTYTFTPTDGQCATATMTIVVNPRITPTFNQIAPICQDDLLAPLPITSNNSVSGTWSPAVNTTATTTYTFTPIAGSCANTTTMIIVVNPRITPTFSGIGPICFGDTSFAYE